MKEKIKEVAYRIWEEEGCPHGKHDEHWVMAEVIVLEECPCGCGEKSCDCTGKTVKAKKASAKKKVPSKKKVVAKKKVIIKKKK